MTMFQMYLLTRMDAINGIGVAISIVFGVGGIFFFALGGMLVSDRNMQKETHMLWLKRIFIGFLCGLPFAVLCPTSQEMAAIIIVPKIANNAKIQEVPDKLMTLATEWLEELRPKKDH